LDEGVLTSGRGEKVYFTEAFIVFTSNLGTYQTNNTGVREATVLPTDTFEKIQKCIREEIGKHFKLTLNRPEILNRIGENLIVFDFIRDEVAEQIFVSMVNTVFSDLKALRDIEVSITSSAMQVLRKLCLSDLSNGGRGIRNKIEMHLVNPLSRAIFDEDIEYGSYLSITSVDQGAVTKLNLCRVSQNEKAAL
jgi:ATP-dependent Clp protease ATP-binding subunit ClpA